MLPYKKGEERIWARERLQGVCNVVVPSYTRDLSDINEAAIRHDVRKQLEFGFAGFLLVSETAITPEEYLRFVKYSKEESQGNQILIHHSSFNTMEQNIEMTQKAGEQGAELALMSFPPSFYPTSIQELEDYISKFASSVDMAVMLFPVPLWGFERLHPASHPVDMMERLVKKHSNIVAIKAEGGHPSVGGFVETWNRLSDEVVVTMPLENQGIPLAMLVPMQLIATSNTETFGPVIPKAFAAARAGNHEEAMKLFWQVDPARRANEQIGAFGGQNTVHRMGWKYQAWLNGYNGGPLRVPTSRLVGSQMRMLRKGAEDSGLDVTSDNDEDFFLGRNPA